MIKNIGTLEAIRAINPQAKVVVFAPDNIEWIVGNEIPKADIDAKILELRAEWTANEYARNRQAEYPSVGDQMDMLMKDMKNGTTTHQTACEAVKTKYPKP